MAALGIHTGLPMRLSRCLRTVIGNHASLVLSINQREKFCCIDVLTSLTHLLRAISRQSLSVAGRVNSMRVLCQADLPIAMLLPAKFFQELP
jgi:hypothetical protein